MAETQVQFAEGQTVRHVAESTRSERINLRATPHEIALIRQAAGECRMTMTEFMIMAATREAERVMAESATTEVPEEAFVAFSQDVTRTGASVDGFAQAVKRPRRLKMPTVEDNTQLPPNVREVLVGGNP